MLRSLRYSYSAACAAVLALLLTSCSPSYFLTVQPRHANGPRVNGNPTSLHQHEDSVQVRTSFVRYEEKELVFEVAVSNESGRPVLVAPETFFYVPRDSSLALPASASSMQPRIAALDPELRLTQLAARLGEEDTKAGKVSWLELLTTVTHVAEDVSSINKKETAAQIAEREQRHENDNAFYDNQRADHAQQADNLYDQYQNLASVALRKTTLAPGQVVVGQVHFPRTDAAPQLHLVVFFNNRPVAFDFVQKRQTYQQAYAPTATDR